MEKDKHQFFDNDAHHENRWLVILVEANSEKCIYLNREINFGEFVGYLGQKNDNKTENFLD